MNENFDSILEQCLSQLAAGKVSIENCLARYPDQAGELRPLLAAAEQMRAVPKPTLSAEAKARIEERLLEAHAGSAGASSLSRRAQRRPVWRWATIGLGALLPTALVAVFLLVALVSAVGDTLPGSPFHSVQLAAEDTWLWLAPDSEKPRLRLHLARRRLDEVEALRARGSVDLTVVEAMTKQTEAALTGVEDLPPAKAVSLAGDLMALIADQQRSLSELIDDDQTTPQEEDADGFQYESSVTVALQTSEAHKDRAQTLVSVLPMPPVIAVSETVRTPDGATPVSLPEPGGVVEFTVRVTNEGAEEVRLTALENEIRGEPSGQNGCSIGPEGLRLVPGGFYECSFHAFVFRNAGESETDKVTATAVDDEGNVAQVSASASVAVIDVLPVIRSVKVASPGSVPEPGDTVQFMVQVTNDSVEDVMLTTLADDVHGDLNGQGDCLVPAEGVPLVPGQAYACTFSEEVRGNAGETETGTVTAVAADDEGNRVKASDSAAVSVTDVLPHIRVSKTAAPTIVPEPGDTVQLTVQVTNDGVEPVNLTALVDDIHGDLNGQGKCSVPPEGIALPVGEWYECTFQAEVSGNAGDSEAGTVVAFASDDEGNSVDSADSATVKVIDVLPTISIAKSSVPNSVPEPGAAVEYTVSVTNGSVEDVNLISLVDDVHGDLTDQGTSSMRTPCFVPAGGITLSPNGVYRCSFSTEVTGNAGTSETNTVTAVATDDEGNRAKAAGRATVAISDVLPRIVVNQTACTPLGCAPAQVPEPGDAVEFSVQVSNNSVEDVTLVSLVDDIHGNLAGRGTCSLPQGGTTISPGEAYGCAFSADVKGNGGHAETNTVTAVAVDDEENQVRSADSATVAVTDVMPSIAVLKTVSPNVVPEPGGTAQYTVQVTNNSVEDVTISSMGDDVHGNLDGQGTCSVPPGGMTLSPEGTYRCTFSADVTGNAGDTERNIAVVRVSDDEGNRVEASDSATVTIADVIPSISVVKMVQTPGDTSGNMSAPVSVPEPGAMVQFSVGVTNDSVEDVTLTSLVDDIQGDLDGQGTCSLPLAGMILGPGESYQCTFSADVIGNAGEIKTNVATARASDDEGNEAESSDDAAVNITDVLPVIAMVNTASLETVSEPGGVVEFTVHVTNNSVEDVWVTSLVDDIQGDLNGWGTCSVPPGGIMLSPGGTYDCTFSGDVTGNAGEIKTNVVTALASDDEGNEAESSDSAAVSITDVLPVIAVAKTVSPASVPEPGGVVEFTVRVINTGVEDILVTSLLDDVYGDLNGRGTCSLPTGTVGPGGSYDCAFGAEVGGNAGDTLIATVTAQASDDEGAVVEASGSSEVSITDVLPAITVVATANPDSVPEPGGAIELTVLVNNDSSEPVILASLVGQAAGDLSARGTCSVPSGGIALAPAESYACVFDIDVWGSAGVAEIDTITAVASDDEGNEAMASDSATVSITDVQPQAALTMAADPTSIPEPGGTVQFAVRVINQSVEGVALVALVDDVHGDLNGQGTCSVPPEGSWLAPGDLFECAFGADAMGYSGDSVTKAVTAVIVDDDGNQVEAVGSVTVGITDPLPPPGG